MASINPTQKGKEGRERIWGKEEKENEENFPFMADFNPTLYNPLLPENLALGFCLSRLYAFFPWLGSTVPSNPREGANLLLERDDFPIKAVLLPPDFSFKMSSLHKVGIMCL